MRRLSDLIPSNPPRFRFVGIEPGKKDSDLSFSEEFPNRRACKAAAKASGWSDISYQQAYHFAGFSGSCGYFIRC